ncbi:MAG: FRG domain-containing protein [Victivallales bacterium]
MGTEFASIKFESWPDLLNFGRGLDNWFYRGQSCANWSLMSSLERAIGSTHNPSWDCKHTEQWMLRKFCGFAHNYLAHPPKDDDLLEWLALMQHHGAPTRLLDCTYSFPVAAFFAAREAKTDFAVWAFNWNLFSQSAIARFGLKIDPMFAALEFHTAMHAKANEFLTNNASGALAFPTVLFHSNERLEAQQGMFLFPCDPSHTLLENIECLIDKPVISSINEPSNIIRYDATASNVALFRQHWLLKLVLPKEERFNTLIDLHRMNIHDASLFPGLDGFTRSLGFYSMRDQR